MRSGGLVIKNGINKIIINLNFEQMEKKVIYSNETAIRDLMNGFDGYKETKGNLQGIINEMMSEGIPIVENALVDLRNDSKVTKEATRKLIKAEMEKKTFGVEKDEVWNKLQPLIFKVDEYASRLNKVIGGNHLTPVNHFVLDGHNVKLIDGL